MKIIYIHNNYEPAQFPKEPDKQDRFFTYGFGSNFARNFKKYNPEFEVEMWRLDAYCKKYYEKEVQGVFFRIFPSVKIDKVFEFSLKFIRELKKEVKISDPVLFVTHTHTSLLYQIALLFKNSPIFTSHHGDWSPFFKIKRKLSYRIIKDALDVLIEKSVLKNVDYFLICDYNQIPYIKKAAPEAKFVIYSTGVNVDSFSPVEKDKAKSMLGWDKNKKYILYVGQLYNLKQCKEMIDIWSEIKQNNHDVELVVIGNSENDEYYNYAVNAGAKVLGRILNKELNIYYSAADVYLLLALRDDYFGGIGIAVLESLLCNTPVVSYSLRNYIGENFDELGEAPKTLDEYKCSILKVLNNTHQYNNTRKNIERYYSYAEIAKSTKFLFNEIIKKRKSK